MNNRWFTKDGKAKRIPEEFKFLKPFAEANKNLITANKTLELLVCFKKTFGLTNLTDLNDLLLAFTGIFNNHNGNETNEHLQNRYEHGIQIISKLPKEYICRGVNDL